MFLNYLDIGKSTSTSSTAAGARCILRHLNLMSRPQGEAPSEHLQFFETCPSLLRDGELSVRSCRIRPGIPMERQDPYDMIWIRTSSSSRLTVNQDVVFATHLPGPFIGEKMIASIRACIWGMLTCLELPAMKFHQV